MFLVSDSNWKSRRCKGIVFDSHAFPLVDGVAIFLIAASKRSVPLYGTFVYPNVDSSVATATITEQNANFENVILHIHSGIPFFLTMDEFGKPVICQNGFYFVEG